MITKEQSSALETLFGPWYINEILQECEKRNVVRQRKGTPVTAVDVSYVFKGHRAHPGIEAIIWELAAIKKSELEEKDTLLGIKKTAGDAAVL